MEADDIRYVWNVSQRSGRSELQLEGKLVPVDGVAVTGLEQVLVTGDGGASPLGPLGEYRRQLIAEPAGDWDGAVTRVGLGRPGHGRVEGLVGELVDRQDSLCEVDDMANEVDARHPEPAQLCGT
jgi:hypothetical protein